jgi:putative phosphoribosyl transferase
LNQFSPQLNVIVMNTSLASNLASNGRTDRFASTDRPRPGLQLGQQLAQYHQHPAAMIYAIPGGEGLTLARELAAKLDLPVTDCCVQKLVIEASPQLSPQLVIGAVAANQSRILNYDVIRQHNITAEAITQSTIAALQTLDAMPRSPQTTTPIVILVDDGVGTGAAVRAAIAQFGMAPAKVVLARPAHPAASREQLEALVDEFVEFVRLEPLSELAAPRSPLPNVHRSRSTELVPA